jgi:uncharacterized protein YwqG
MEVDRMDKVDVQKAITAAGLARLTKDIDLISKASIRLYTTAVDEFLLSVGASKIGGLPDLPPGTNWPQLKGMPQSFITQIRMDDVHPYDTNGVLPKSGMLWFFYNAQQQTFGADPADRGGWQVIFKDGDLGGLKRTPAPAQLPASSQFKACTITFASETTLSQQPKLEIPDLDWTDAEQKQYEQLLSTFPNAADRAMVHHRLLGHPDTIQDDMRLECQLASHGLTDVKDPRASELSKGAMDWQLLLQIDSDEQADMEWGNTGMLYYWISGTDLQACRFDTTWLVLQSE